MWSYPRRRCRRRPAVQSNIPRLPVEVLEIIFKYLSANERKAVKLVCRSWFEICNTPPLLNDEVLNCIGIYRISDINQFLARSQRRVLNLKFDNVAFNNDLSLWKNNGSKIRSIIFKNCELDCGCFEAAIIYCPNLVHLSFIYETIFHDDLDSIVEDLERVVRTGIVRQNLNFLEIYLEASMHAIGDGALYHLFFIFPKVKILKIHFDKQVGDDFRDMARLDSSRDYSKSLFTFTPVLNYLLASTDRIEKLKLYIRFHWSQHNSYTIHRLLEILAAMKKLTDLSINLGPMSILLEQMVETFLCSKPLKSLTYHSSNRDRPLELFSRQLLRSNSCLKQMKIRASNEELFSAYYNLFKKGLKPFLQQFQNLIHHLHLDDISCEDLQLVSKYQKKLKSLIIGKEKEVGHTSYFFEHKLRDFVDAFHQLKDIEHLELTHSVSHMFLRSLSPRSVLANLKYLKINFHQHDYHYEWFFGLQHTFETVPSHLLRLADAMPFLEALWVDLGKDIPFRTCLQLCAKLSRLRYFRSTDKIWFRKKISLREKRENLQKLFSICHSLRVLVCHKWVFYFDIINKKVVSSEMDKVDWISDWRYFSPRTLARPKIGGHRVDWLIF